MKEKYRIANALIWGAITIAILNSSGALSRGDWGQAVGNMIIPAVLWFVIDRRLRRRAEKKAEGPRREEKKQIHEKAERQRREEEAWATEEFNKTVSSTELTEDKNQKG